MLHERGCMSFEIDAVMVQPAPQPTRAAQAAASSDAGPNFEDHLSEAAAAEPDAKPEPKPRAEATDKSEAAAEPVAAPQASPVDPAPPVLIQLIASVEPTQSAPAPSATDAIPAADRPIEAAPASTNAAPTLPAPEAPKPDAGVKSQGAAPILPPPEAARPDAHAKPQAAAPGPPPPQAPIPDAGAKSQAAVQTGNVEVKPLSEANKSDAPRAADAEQAGPTAEGEAPVAPAPAPQTKTAPEQPQAVAQLPLNQIAAPPTQGADKRAVPQTVTIDDEVRSDAPGAGPAFADATDAKAATAVAPSANAAKANTPPPRAGQDGFSAALAAWEAPEAPTANIASPPAATTNAVLAAPMVQASHATQEAAAAFASAAPVAAQVGREIIRRFNGESTFFELRLDPPEMGRIEVRLEVSRDNRVTALVAADNPQALADLARNARGLEQALQSAGLELSEDGLSFDLNQHRESPADSEAAGASRRGASDGSEAQTNPAPAARPISFERWRGVRVDLMA